MITLITSNWETTLTSKGQRSRSQITKNVKIVFPRIFVKWDRGQNDRRPIGHISSNALHQRKCVMFEMFVCLSHVCQLRYSKLERLRKFECYREVTRYMNVIGNGSISGWAEFKGLSGNHIAASRRSGSTFQTCAPVFHKRLYIIYFSLAKYI